MTRRNSPSPKPKSYPKTAFPFTRTVAEDERLLLLILATAIKNRTTAAGREQLFKSAHAATSHPVIHTSL